MSKPASIPVPPWIRNTAMAVATLLAGTATLGLIQGPVDKHRLGQVEQRVDKHDEVLAPVPSALRDIRELQEREKAQDQILLRLTVSEEVDKARFEWIQGALESAGFRPKGER